MSIGDQAQNKAEELTGKAKDVAGDVTDDQSLKAEGKADQASANVKQLGDKAQQAADDVGDAVVHGHGVIGRLSQTGFRSEWAYIGGFASIGISLGSWFVSRNKTGDSKSQSDRWGIFIGHWAPTFMALGVALKLEEEH